MNRIWNLPLVTLQPFDQLEDRRPALVVTSGPAWNAVHARLGGLNIAARVEVSQATVEDWNASSAGIAAGSIEVVYAIGGGLAVDAAKHLAVRFDRQLVCLPTALSVDAFLTAASGVRQDGCVRYIETKPPEQLVADFAVLAAAPAGIRAAGICDVLSIATGSWDWQFAEQRGMNPPGMAFIPWVYENARSILQGALDCAAAAGAGDPDGLKQLLDCLAMEVQLCNQVGHARPEEGSEHYFAYCVENLAGHGLPHGDLLAPGLLTMAARQGQDPEPLRRAMQASGVPLERVSPQMQSETLRCLPAYCRQHNLPYGIAHAL